MISIKVYMLEYKNAYRSSSVMFSSDPTCTQCELSHVLATNFNFNIPPMAVLIGAGPPCCTCVIMLAAAPAAAMTYVNPSSGLLPSVYGGGGSPSSRSLLPCPSLVSLGSAALVSATTELAAASDSSNGGAGPEGAKTVRDALTHSVTKARYGSAVEGAGK